MEKFRELLQRAMKKEVTEEMAIELYDSYKGANNEGRENINKKFLEVTGWNLITIMNFSDIKR